MFSRIASAFRDSFSNGSHPAQSYPGQLVRVPNPRRDCAEAYRVVGVLAEHLGALDHPDVIVALENLVAAARGEPRPYDDLLPWPKEPLPLPDPAEDRAIALAVRAVASDDGNEVQIFARDLLMLASTLVEADRIKRKQPRVSASVVMQPGPVPPAQKPQKVQKRRRGTLHV